MMSKLPVCIKLRNRETYYMLLDEEELVALNFETSTNSLLFGKTERLIDNEVFGEIMLGFHEEVSINVFNKKVDQYFSEYNDFIVKLRFPKPQEPKPRPEDIIPPF